MKDNVTSLKDQARHETDPAELRRIANLLQTYGAWDEADKARNKALNEERKMAEQVAR